MSASGRLPKGSLGNVDLQFMHYATAGKYGSAPICMKDKYVIIWDGTQTAEFVTCPKCLACLRPTE